MRRSREVSAFGDRRANGEPPSGRSFVEGGFLREREYKVRAATVAGRGRRFVRFLRGHSFLLWGLGSLGEVLP